MIAARRLVGGHVRTTAALLILLLPGHSGFAQRAAPPPAEPPACTFTVQNDVPTPMRDGTVLRANVYTPDQPGPHPIVLIRTPYNKDRPFNGAYGGPAVGAGRCYIAVAQDVRGQYKSDGVWYPFRSEATDGYDTIEWAAALPK
jgi:predicted acyl esterase